MRLVIIASLLVLSAPAAAQVNADDAASAAADATDIDPDLVAAQREKARSEARKAAADARKAEIEAEAALEKARFSFLPQSPAEGKVTLGEGAGAAEAAMLTTIAIQAAAVKIKTAAEPAAGTLLLAGSETLDLSALLTFQAEAMGVETQLKDALGVEALTPCSTGAVGVELVPAIGPAVTALAGMLRTDTELRGIKTEVSSQVLARAVAANVSGLIVPTYRAKPIVSSSNAVVCTLQRLDTARAQARAKLAATPAPTGDVKTRLEAAADRANEFHQSWTKPAENGTVKLAGAIAQADLVPNGTKVLRVHLDSQGGSLLTRRNLWTALGAKAIAISGGAVASFTLDDPFTGAVDKSGVFVCGTTLTDFRRVQKLERLRGKCIPE